MSLKIAVRREKELGWPGPWTLRWLLRLRVGHLPSPPVLQDGVCFGGVQGTPTIFSFSFRLLDSPSTRDRLFAHTTSLSCRFGHHRPPVRQAMRPPPLAFRHPDPFGPSLLSTSTTSHSLHAIMRRSIHPQLTPSWMAFYPPPPFQVLFFFFFLPFTQLTNFKQMQRERPPHLFSTTFDANREPSPLVSTCRCRRWWASSTTVAEMQHGPILPCSNASGPQ
jgi:hypothetical protein